MRALLGISVAAIFVASVLRAQEPVPAPPPAPPAVAPADAPPSMPLTIPDPPKKAPSPPAPKKVDASGDVHLDGDLEAVPVLDSVPVWYYPKGKLRQSARVVFQAIIDTLGRIEPNSIKLVSTTDSSFIEAGRLTLMMTYYHPARAHGRPVRAMVKQSLKFDRNGRRACEVNPVTPMLPPKC